VAEKLDEQESRVVGFIGYWLIGDEVHISTFAIHPDYRMQGIGELMMVQALGMARSRGAKVATLEVRVSNSPAIHLYHKLGFVQVGTRAGYYRDNGEDAYLMTLHTLAGLEPR
jgi:ribosomal-protein-alanine N-acetyltransferase